MANARIWSESIVIGLLCEKYQDGKFTCFPKLRTGVGFSRQEIDFYAINTWESQLIFEAYEIKVSRSDFLNEIKNAQKREQAMSLSNMFIFITTPGVAKSDEIPSDCGWIEISEGGKLFCKKTALYRKLGSLPTDFVAMLSRKSDQKFSTNGLFRYAGKEMTEKDIDAIVKERFGEKVRFEAKQHYNAAHKELEMIKNDLAERQGVIDRLEHLERELNNGEPFSRWSIHDKIVKEHQPIVKHLDALVSAKEKLEHIIGLIESSKPTEKETK